MKFTWRTEWPLWLLLIAMFVLAALTWPSAPDRIPMHWGVDGQVNGYGGKLEGLLLIPLVALILYLFFLALPKLDPLHANYARFAGAYTLFRFSILLFLALIYLLIHLWIRGYRAPVNMVIPILVGVLFLILARVLGRVRPNWFVGIRTPWTLSSKLAWTKTHRVAQWVFTILGLGLILSGILRSIALLIGVIAATAVGTFGMIFYSYVVWRDDPERIPPSVTLHTD